MIAVRVLGIVALATFATQVLGEDDFPIVGTYTENTPCTGDGPNAARVTITAHEINSAFGLCAILSRQREGPAFAVRVQCKSPDGTQTAARLLSEGEARPLHFLRQLPANASEGIPAVRRPEAMTAASATGTDLIMSLTTSLVRLRKVLRQHVRAPGPGPPNVPGALITLRRDALG